MSLVPSMRRVAARAGQVISYDQILNHDREFTPGLDKLRVDSPPRFTPEPTASTPSHGRVS